MALVQAVASGVPEAEELDEETIELLMMLAANASDEAGEEQVETEMDSLLLRHGFTPAQSANIWQSLSAILEYTENGKRKGAPDAYVARVFLATICLMLGKKVPSFNMKPVSAVDYHGYMLTTMMDNTEVALVAFLEREHDYVIYMFPLGKGSPLDLAVGVLAAYLEAEDFEEDDGEENEN